MLKAIKQIGELAEKKYCIVKRDNSGQKKAATKLEREIGQLRQRILQKKTEKQDCYERYIMVGLFAVLMLGWLDTPLRVATNFVWNLLVSATGFIEAILRAVL